MDSLAVGTGSGGRLDRQRLHEPLLTAREVSKLLGDIPPKTVLQYAREGRLPCLKIGRHVRFVRSELDRACARNAGRRRACRDPIAQIGLSAA